MGDVLRQTSRSYMGDVSRQTSRLQGLALSCLCPEAFISIRKHGSHRENKLVPRFPWQLRYHELESVSSGWAGGGVGVGEKHRDPFRSLGIFEKG